MFNKLQLKIRMDIDMIDSDVIMKSFVSKFNTQLAIVHELIVSS